MTVDQWNKLAAFIKSEARSAATYRSKSSELIRAEYEEDARTAFLTKEQIDGL